MLRLHYLAGFAYLALCAAALRAGGAGPGEHEPTPYPGAEPSVSGDATEWLSRAKPFCNAVEVETLVARLPPPATLEGRGAAAGCFALAGKLERARGYLLQVDPGQRWRAAGIVFDLAHPVADAGDDRSAGPIMELVVEFWPNHYMARYHAGAAAYALGQRDAARSHLTDFLRTYEVRDGWRQSAEQMLRDLRRR